MRCCRPLTGSSSSRQTSPASESKLSLMSRGSAATKTRTVGDEAQFDCSSPVDVAKTPRQNHSDIEIDFVNVHKRGDQSTKPGCSCR